MFRTLTLSAALTAAALIALPVAAQRLKVTTQTVPVFVTVTDSDRRLVTDLVQD